MKLHIPVYSCALLLSAILVFTVQPMFTKMVLPLLGGTPQVWNTSMLFFQLCLLGGYAYAHATTRFFSVRIQAFLHIALLALFSIILPFAIPDTMYPSDTDNPTIWQLSTMLTILGGPFLVISGSAPMLQRWFAASSHKSSDNPYFLYGASNLGSMSALLLYPVLIEPSLTISEQTQFWKIGYLALIVFSALCLTIVWNNKEKKQEDTEDSEHITATRRIKWIILSFIPASLMLGVTTHITTDIASAPLLWVMPLALYIGTFIIAFARSPIINSNQAATLSGVFIILIILEQLLPDIYTKANPLTIVFIHFTAFFFATLVCHIELANAKPKASHLTEFYLIMSFGGALGGFTNSILAPNFFIIPLEYPLALIMATLARHSSITKHSLHTLKTNIIKNTKETVTSNNALLIFFAILFGLPAFYIGDTKVKTLTAVLCALPLLALIPSRWPFALTTGLIILFPIMFGIHTHNLGKVLERDRNFFGLMSVIESDKKRLLLHGTTVHGEQLTIEKYRLLQTSYYSKSSPITDIFDILDETTGKQDIAVLGLGVGVTACYNAPDRHFDFYEIDQAVVDIAENTKYFTFLSDCGSPYKIILGDGRIKVAEQPRQKYDTIIVDVFSSDNIPVHLITKEAIQTYMNKLKPDGMLGIHISNRYLDLEPLLSATGKEIGINVYSKTGTSIEIEDTGTTSHISQYVLFTENPAIIEYLKSADWKQARTKDGLKPWTDQYSDIIGSFRWMSFSEFLKYIVGKPAAAKTEEQ